MSLLDTLPVYIKIHKDRYWRWTIAICDAELIGKEFGEGVMHLQTHEQFYKGELTTRKDIAEKARNAYMVNAVGTIATTILTEEGVITKKDILWIAGIPHAQIIKAP